MERAFSGAHAIFAVTDFWQFPTSPRTHDLAKAENITWNEACYRLEVQQGINIIDAAARCFAMTGTPERLVYSSLSGAKRASKGKYTWVYHFDSKARVVEYLAEKAQDGEGAEYKALLAKTSYLQLGSYMDNWMKNPLVMPRKVSVALRPHHRPFSYHVFLQFYHNMGRSKSPRVLFDAKGCL